MRNLKKILALVLALVMSMSVMSVASADFKDADKIDAKFTEAVDVLNALGVFQGDEKGNFNPQGAITRAEVAAIIYRIDTGDVKDVQKDIYADYNKFDDVKSTAWYAGYVNYCANALYIKGYDENTFGPNDKVTGYQALAMILRVVGYDQNNEFSGSAWQIEVAKYANKLGITDTVNANTLGVAATRELVAELLFRTICLVPQVTYTLALGYNQYQSTLIDEKSKLNPTIGEEMFGLGYYENQIIDTWGRPGDVWVVNYTGNFNVDYWTYGRDIVVYPYTPVNTYTVATTECEIALDLGYNAKELGKNTEFETIFFDNGVQKKIGINPVHEHDKVKAHLVGGQGTLIEVYERNPYTNADDTIVLIETYLAEVTGLTKQVTDKAGHVITKATNTLHIYTGADEAVDWTAKIDGNDYAVGDFVLVNVNEGWEYVDALGVASTIVATQTQVWWNAEKHTLDKVDYMDNENFQLDEAQYDTAGQYIWFMDQYGNVIGDIKYVNHTYAYVINAQWINEKGSNGYALCTVKYLDGTEEQLTIKKINGKNATYADMQENGLFENAQIYTTLQYNSSCKYHLYEVKGNQLFSVTPEFNNAVITDGVSQVKADNGSFFTNNFTKYVVYDRFIGQYFEFTGYDNVPQVYPQVPSTIVGEKVDVLYNGNYASVVYVYGYFGYSMTEGTKTEFVYFTGDNMNFQYVENADDDYFALYGVARLVKGQLDLSPLFFKADHFGDVDTTRTMLLEMIALWQDTLCLVKTVDADIKDTVPALVESVTPVNIFTGMVHGTQVAQYAASFEYSFIDASGVLMLNGSLALNVNTTTTIINDGEIGTEVDLTEAALLGKAIYVVYTGTTASTIYITDTSYLSDEEMLYSLTATSFSDVVVTGEMTAENVAAAINAQSAAIRFIRELGIASYVEVNAVETGVNYVTVELLYNMPALDSEMLVGKLITFAI